MNDAAAMSCVKRASDLDRPSHSGDRRNGPSAQTFRQRLAFDVLHDEVRDALLRPHVVDCTDVRMVQAGYRLGFTLDPRPPDGIVGGAWRENFDGDVAVQ